ncbi:MAG: hypothetical protein IJS83_07215 [Acholeplasmatales bacterium]|nr:hypothetical protein [Acholeplasmatales bacterium]
MKSIIKSIIYCRVAILAITAIFLMFTPFVSGTNGTTYYNNYTGFELAFGYRFIGSSSSFSNVLSSSFAGIMVFIFFIIITILACLNIFMKNSKLNILFNIIIIVLSIVSIVFLLCSPTSLMFKNIFGQTIPGYSIGIGAIIDAIIMLIIIFYIFVIKILSNDKK